MFLSHGVMANTNFVFVLSVLCVYVWGGFRLSNCGHLEAELFANSFYIRNQVND